MATFAEVREALDGLEQVRLRGEDLKAKRLDLLDQVVRLEADIAQLSPAIEAAETAFRALVADLDFSKP